MDDGMPVVHGLPWCGTSNRFDTATHPLGGIILLRRSAKGNHVEGLSLSEKILLTDQRLISPSWTPELFCRNLSLIRRIAPEVLICRLRCTKEPDAAEEMKKYIDRYLAGDH